MWVGNINTTQIKKDVSHVYGVFVLIVKEW